MFGFPLPLFDIAGTVKLASVSDSGFPKPVQSQTFYSIKAGNWSDVSVWQTASGIPGTLPSANDDVFIRHNVVFDTGSNTDSTGIRIRNLFISASAILSYDGIAARNLYVLGACQILGTLNMTGASFTMSLVLHTDNNRIDNYIGGTRGTIIYNGGAQRILPIAYQNLILASNEPVTNNPGGFTNGLKSLIADTTVLGNLTLGQSSGGIGTLAMVVFEVGFNTLTVNGITGTASCLWKSTMKGTMIFVGNVDMSGSSFQAINWSDTTVEFRGGCDLTSAGMSSSSVWAGTASFTTNNQNFSGFRGSLGAINIDATITIAAGITVTQPATGGTGGAGLISLTSTMNGTNAGSTFINKSTLDYATQNAAENSMTTGVIDVSSFTNTLGFTGNYSCTIPTFYSTCSSLTVTGTGTKTLAINTTVNSNISINTSGTLECSTFNLTITGTTTLGGSGAGTLSKNSGTGSILFVGKLSSSVAGNVSLSGNCNTEFRGGIDYTNASWNMGSGTVSFTTNNQAITDAGGSIAATLGTGAVSIVGAITLTIGINTSDVNVGSIDCTSASGSLVNKGRLNITTNTASMTTGTFDISSFVNTVGYTGNYSLTLPLTTYYSLKINGSGTKTLGGNTTLSGNLTLASGGILELSTFNFTVNGTVSNNSTLSKSGNGNVLFVGLYTASPGNTTFSSSPVVEFRAGILYTNHTFTWASTTVKFTTNNQAVTFGAGTVGPSLPNVTISGAITLTIDSTAATTVIITGALDGDNASSKLLMAANSLLNYKSATKPFATNGVLDTSTNTNTWTYGLNNQDILGGPSVGAKQVYKNLTLNGTGTKTLQGYVSVLNTYTLTAPATLNNNGFTLTNP